MMQKNADQSFMIKRRARVLIFCLLVLCGWVLGGRQGAMVLEYLREEKAANEQKAALQAEVLALQNNLDALRAQKTQESARSQEMEQAILLAQTQAGRSAMQGDGLVITLDDAKMDLRAGNPNWSLVHDVDLLRVINELRAGGARGISVNGVRVMGQTRVRCGGPTIHVRERKLFAPFIITAVGPAAEMLAQFDRPLYGSATLRDEFTAFGLQFSIKKGQGLLVPSHVQQGQGS